MLREICEKFVPQTKVCPYQRSVSWTLKKYFKMALQQQRSTCKEGQFSMLSHQYQFSSKWTFHTKMKKNHVDISNKRKGARAKNQDPSILKQ